MNTRRRGSEHDSERTFAMAAGHTTTELRLGRAQPKANDDIDERTLDGVEVQALYRKGTSIHLDRTCQWGTHIYS